MEEIGLKFRLPHPRDVKDTGAKKPSRPIQYYTGQINDLTAYFYYGKYIPRDVVRQCYRKGQITNINKWGMGNGFTTSVFEEPPQQGRVKILIEPNLEVLRNKGKKYSQRKYLFLHSDTHSNVTDWDYKTEFIVTTTDTFRYIVIPFIVENKKAELIESVTIDESHKISQSANFRDALIDFYHKVSLEVLKLNPEIAIVNVTASAPLSTNPFYYWGGYSKHDYNPFKIDILLTPVNKDKTEIHRNNNEEKLVQDIKNLISQGERVMVFTNNYRIIYQFIENGELNATLIAGQGIARSVYYRAEVTENKDFIISTSSGFEGWDAEGDGWHIYLFSDSNLPEHTIGITDTDQSIGRAREGVKKITFCEIPFYQTTDTFGNVRTLKTAFEEIKIIEGRRNFREIDLIKKSLHGKSNLKLKKSKEIINSMAKEYESEELKVRPIYEQLYSDLEETERRKKAINDQVYLDHYWKFKGVEFIDEDITPNRVQKVWTLEKDRKYLKANKELILQKKLNDYRLKLYGNSADSFMKAFDDWLFFRSLSPETDLKSDKVLRFMEYVYQWDDEGNRTPDLSHLEAFLASLIDFRTKDLRARLKGESDEGIQKELTTKIERVEKGTYQRNILTLIAFLLNDEKKMKPETPLNVYREYNFTTKMDIPSMEKVYDWMGVVGDEFDIRSCAWRIIYGICKTAFPDDFYGKNKKNKLTLNKVLNQLSAPAVVKRSKGKFEEFKVQKKKKLENLKVPASVYNWLVDTFADKPSDEVFNTYTYHENIIIEKITGIFPSYASIIRRHDSIIVFDFDWDSDIGQEVLERIKGFQYMGAKGWFMPEDEAVQVKDTNILYSEENVTQYRLSFD
jgi:hypothetical protein